MDKMSNLVVQSNILLNSVPLMKNGSFKIFLTAVSKVRQNSDTDSRTVKLDYLEVSEVLTSQHARARRYRVVSAIKQLLRESVFQIRVYDEDKGRWVDRMYAPISTAEVDADEITISFSTDIMPYISNLSKNFTKYELQNIHHLGTNSSISIYQILRNAINKACLSKNLKKQDKDKLLNPIYQVEFLKEITNCANKYSVFKDFERRILKPSVESINANTDLVVAYKKIKIGRSISQIQFFLEEKKTDELDEIIQLDTSSKNINVDDVYNKIIHSHHLNQLIGAHILDPVDISDQNKIVSLEKLISKYGDFERDFSRKKLENHLAYVKKNMRENSATNLAEYLEKSLDNYIDLLNSGIEKKQGKQRKKVIQKETLPEWALLDQLEQREKRSKNTNNSVNKVSDKDIQEMLDRTR